MTLWTKLWGKLAARHLLQNLLKNIFEEFNIFAKGYEYHRVSFTSLLTEKFYFLANFGDSPNKTDKHEKLDTGKADAFERNNSVTTDAESHCRLAQCPGAQASLVAPGSDPGAGLASPPSAVSPLPPPGRLSPPAPSPSLCHAAPPRVLLPALAQQRAQ